jgi:hypothetical protein
MSTADTREQGYEVHAAGIGPVRGPVSVAWREGTLTRAEELESLCAWVMSRRIHAGPSPLGWRRGLSLRSSSGVSRHARFGNYPRENAEGLKKAIADHIEAAREAAERAELKPKKRFRVFRNGPLIERAMSNLDAAEAHILNLAPSDYILGQMPSLLAHVQRHLIPNDPRRQEFERIARKLGVKDPDHPLMQDVKEQKLEDKLKIVEEERGKIVTAVRGASSAALREQLRVRSFRNLLAGTTVVLAMLAIGVALVGFFYPTWIPMCFAPEESGRTVVVCPTGQSQPFIPADQQSSTDAQPSDLPVEDIDDEVIKTATRHDLIIVELVGLTAAAVAAAAAIRGIRGSSERYWLPAWLAVLKLPTGAITAFLGLLLIRGQFVPGLSALDTPAQILAWALVFGYAQQIFTRLVDQQGQTVLESVRGADKQQQPSPP